MPRSERNVKQKINYDLRLIQTCDLKVALIKNRPDTHCVVIIFELVKEAFFEPFNKLFPLFKFWKYCKMSFLCDSLIKISFIAALIQGVLYHQRPSSRL